MLERVFRSQLEIHRSVGLKEGIIKIFNVTVTCSPVSLDSFRVSTVVFTSVHVRSTLTILYVNLWALLLHRCTVVLMSGMFQSLLLVLSGKVTLFCPRLTEQSPRLNTSRPL